MNPEIVNQLLSAITIANASGNTELVTQLTTMLSTMINTNTSTNNNNNNELFTENKNKNIIKLQDLKPSISFNEFIENIEYMDYNDCGENQLEKFLGRTIINNLDKYSKEELPIVMTNKRTKTIYIYNDGQWKLDEKNEATKKMIADINHKYFMLVMKGNSYKKGMPDSEAIKRNKIIINFCLPEKITGDQFRSKIITNLTNNLSYDNTTIKV